MMVEQRQCSQLPTITTISDWELREKHLPSCLHAIGAGIWELLWTQTSRPQILGLFTEQAWWLVSSQSGECGRRWCRKGPQSLMGEPPTEALGRPWALFWGEEVTAGFEESGTISFRIRKCYFVCHVESRLQEDKGGTVKRLLQEATEECWVGLRQQQWRYFF